MSTTAIKSKRVLAGLTQQEVADKIGINYHTYRQKETGKCAFSDEEKVLLAYAIGLTMQDINDIFFDGMLPNGN